MHLVFDFSRFGLVPNFRFLLEAKALYIPALSPIYEPQKLAQIFSGDRTLWMDYIDQEVLQLEQKN